MNVRCQNNHLSRALQSIKDVVLTESNPKSVQARHISLIPCRDALLVVSVSSWTTARMALRVPADIGDTLNDATAYGCDMKELLRLLNNAPAEITLATDEDGHVRLSLPEGFLGITPVPPLWRGPGWTIQEPEGQPIEVDALAALLWQTAPYTSDDETRDMITCVHIREDGHSHVLAEAMDGYQYANARETAPVLHAALPETGLLVRREYASRLASLLSRRILGNEVRMSLDWKETTVDVPARKVRIATGVTFSGEHGSLFLPVPDCPFPNQLPFLKKARAAENVLTLEPRETLRILRMLEPLFDDDHRSVCCDLSPDAVRFSTYGAMVAGEMRLPAKYSGTLARIFFPMSQLRAIVEDNAMAETLRFGFTDMYGPCCITGGENRETVLMPMKVFDDDTRGGAV